MDDEHSEPMFRVGAEVRTGDDWMKVDLDGPFDVSIETIDRRLARLRGILLSHYGLEDDTDAN